MFRSHTRGALLALGLAVATDASAGTVRGSSELRAADVDRRAAHAFDGLLRTAWAPAPADATGVDPTDDAEPAAPWLELALDGPTEIRSVHVWPGELSQGARSLRDHGRPLSLTVTLVGGDEEITRTVPVEHGDPILPQRVDVPVRGTATGIRVSVDQATPGALSDMPHIAEVAVNLTGGDVPQAVERFGTFREGTVGQRIAEKARGQAVSLFEALAGDEAEADDLATLVDRAADGLPDLRARVLRDVPAGFRVHALPPDDVAVASLLKLKDPNGIPGVALAALRATGAAGQKLTQQADMFRAWQELQGGPANDVPPWGRSGWAEGELLGFDEPVNLAVDQHGFLYVADVGNHRVQKFDANGMVVRTWGSGEPALSNTWLSGTRTWHVAGAAPEAKPGHFVNPVGVTTVAGKDADGFAVLDASGRVQTFDPQGNLLLEWNVGSDATLEPGLGGQGHLLESKGQLVAIWGDEAFVYGPDSEELARFELPDAPTGAVVLKNGKLGLVFGGELVMYSLDGFRHGGILGDELGTGFEAWDVALDADRRLWAVTDTGWAVKYKKPGKVEYKVRLTDRPLSDFRIAVRDGVVYLVEGDRIERFDALEMHLQATREDG